MTLSLLTARIETEQGAIKGSGFLISDKHVMTCAHVVTYVLGIDIDTQEKPTGDVYFKFPVSDLKKRYTAKVVCWFPVVSGQDLRDIAVLEINDSEDKPQGLEPLKIASTADFDVHHKLFEAFGFPKGSEKRGVWADGNISGQVIGRLIQIQGQSQTSPRIEPGFSGTAVFSTDLEAIVGMAVREKPNDPQAKIGYMVSSEDLVRAWPPLANLCLEPDNSLQEITEIIETYAESLVLDFDSAYASAKGSVLRRTEKALRVYDKLAELSEYHQDGFSKLERLIVSLYVEQRKSEPNSIVTSKLKEWLEQYTKTEKLIGEPENQIAEETEEQQPDLESTLMIQLTSEVTGYVVNAWLIEDLRAYIQQKDFRIISIIQRQKLSSLTQDVMTEVVKLIRDKAFTAIQNHQFKEETIKRVYFCTPSLSIFKSDIKIQELDFWLILRQRNNNIVRFGEKHQVILSLLEYREKLDTEFFLLWKKKSKQLRNSLSESATMEVMETDHCLKRFYKDIDNDDVTAIRLCKSVSLSKSEPMLEACMDAGIPFVLWTRKNIDTKSRNSKQALTDFCSDNKICDLSRKIHERRCRDYGDKNSLGRHLSMLWDDHMLSLPNIQKQLS